MYFSEFKNIYYPYTIGGKDILRIVKDITTNVRIRKEILSNVTIYDEYDVQDGDTPDIIAARYYGSSQYHWVIMLANDMYDYVNDFPMSTQVLDEYVNEKYNRFDATSWSYVGKTVTATIPKHGIELSGGEVVTVTNAWVTNGDGDEVPASGFDAAMDVTSVTENTVVFAATNAVTGTPLGGLTLYTQDRQYGIHHYEIDGYVVNADDAHSAFQLPVTGAEAVTNYDYETSVNDAKRRIKLITADVVSQITRELGNLI